MKDITKRLIAGLILLILVVLSVLGFINESQGATTDMVDVSNHNGYMTTANFTDMRDNYGVKAVVTKISEGTYYHDYTAANNIQTAQEAGLYINAYHFARYNSVQGAINEANYAVQCARADGLPSGAVIVADVEASEQANQYRSVNNAANQAFMNTVINAGYRSDVYTMGSWLGSTLDIADGSGWIASYPYNASGKNWYNNKHAWQWGSTYQFAGSYGNFDVSQVYDDFYTAGQTPLPDYNESLSNTVVAKGDKYKAYPTYTANGATNEGTDVISSSGWVSNDIQIINGVPMYQIGNNVFLKQSDTTFNKKIVINFPSNVGVKSYNKDGVSQSTEETFKGGTDWLTDNKLYNISGVGYSYKVSTDQYVPMKYTQGSGYQFP